MDDSHHGEVEFFITQLLLGHGFFIANLYRFHLTESPMCPAYGSLTEDVEYSFFTCALFVAERERLHDELGRLPTPETIGSFMLHSQGNWSIVNSVAAIIMRELRRAEVLSRSTSRVVLISILSFICGSYLGIYI